ncbi:hypothetical protein C8N24_6575 [Solirubrobacter pauli]|uniref:Uncharacterized protein n=1 Tax=Solirubrobacter pauli TaxID=166793 RepID=A0A660KV70_9ACTN|nr:hypothetical protein [Solirubrobacter pauli]RKQ84944.1 hypothetical protein C8N24_6575 [Solirubrobacter pauli]
MLRRAPLLLLLLLAGCGSAAAAGEDCLRLDLRSGHGEIEARVRVDTADDWQIVVVHDGHVAWRGERRGPFRYRHRMKDYKGADHVMVRVTAPGGKVCTKTDLVSD